MAYQIQLISHKTYKTEANAVKAVEAKYNHAKFRYTIVCTPEGRYYPICIGSDAIHAGTHFNFVTVG